jgi:hypothetical protein
MGLLLFLPFISFSKEYAQRLQISRAGFFRQGFDLLGVEGMFAHRNTIH